MHVPSSGLVLSKGLEMKPIVDYNSFMVEDRRRTDPDTLHREALRRTIKQKAYFVSRFLHDRVTPLSLEGQAAISNVEALGRNIEDIRSDESPVRQRVAAYLNASQHQDIFTLQAYSAEFA